MATAPTTLNRATLGTPIRLIRVTVLVGRDAGVTIVSKSKTMTIGTAEGNDLRISDQWVSRFHLELRRVQDRVSVRDLGSTNGTEVGPALVRKSSVEVKGGVTITIGETELRIDDGDVVVPPRGPERLAGIVGRSPQIRDLLQKLQKIATSDISAVILGESGTGKELVARAIHDLSPRKTGPFITIDCGSLSPTLFASEFFGHVRGAFTGASGEREGAFERAKGGTIFLDELGDLPVDLQSGLLGVIERRSLRRVGGNHDIDIDVRVLSATSRDLRGEVNTGRFRLDLYYRVATVLLEAPTLASRVEDIPLLVAHFLREEEQEHRLDELFPAKIMQGLLEHPWPGNVRELRNHVYGALAFGEPLAFHQAPGAPGQAEGQELEGIFDQPFAQAKKMVVEDFERKFLVRLMERAEGSIRRASREGKMDRSYLTELLRRHGLK